MKVVRVTIDKVRTPEMTTMSYPSGYDIDVVAPFVYQDEGGDVESCLALVPDDYVGSKGIDIITNADAGKLIDSWVDAIDYLSDEAKEDMKESKLSCLPS